MEQHILLLKQSPLLVHMYQLLFFFSTIGSWDVVVPYS